MTRPTTKPAPDSKIAVDTFLFSTLMENSTGGRLQNLFALVGKTAPGTVPCLSRRYQRGSNGNTQPTTWIHAGFLRDGKFIDAPDLSLDHVASYTLLGLVQDTLLRSNETAEMWRDLPFVGTIETFTIPGAVMMIRPLPLDMTIDGKYAEDRFLDTLSDHICILRDKTASAHEQIALWGMLGQILTAKLDVLATRHGWKETGAFVPRKISLSARMTVDHG